MTKFIQRLLGWNKYRIIGHFNRDILGISAPSVLLLVHMVGYKPSSCFEVIGRVSSE